MIERMTSPMRTDMGNTLAAFVTTLCLACSGGGSSSTFTPPESHTPPANIVELGDLPQEVTFYQIAAGGGMRIVDNPALGDVARSTWDAYGPLVEINSVILSQLDPALQLFFLAHEFGHHYLKA